MKCYVGVTDGDWYRYLAQQPVGGEVNFWRPTGGRAFRTLQVGEPFFFKSHSPHNKVVGGGFFSGFVALRLSEAWEYFETGNGASTAEQMRQRVAHYRRVPLAPREDPEIGCVLIRDSQFFSQEPADAPPNFASNLVQGKTYDMTEPQGAEYFADLMQRLLVGPVEVDPTQPWSRPGPMYGDPRLAPRRLGQQAFQAVVSDAYHRSCAITGDKIRPVLQAAHIRPVTSGGEHRLDNGLLLRSDVHTLYDRGYLGVDPDYRLLVSPQLREEFDSGQEFYDRAGVPIAVPERRVDRPHREFLEWHTDQVFRAS